ncbi:DUF6870 family protein [[Clostridium] fimetarium]|uniref:DUF6870 family protein n=1 Tax=[Clostridium] fimetarium TaxID=99656 RepID=UPI00147AED87|nr:DUF1016 N-terminal domain-containing protein [[Clostridium] fimetarium]
MSVLLNFLIGKYDFQYWKVGRELSQKNSVNKFGYDFVGNVTIGMKKKCIEDKIYNRRGLYRMIQFYEAYSDWDMYGKHLTEINWSSHILLLDRSFWLELCMNKKYSVRKIKEKIEKWKDGILFRLELVDINDVYINELLPIYERTCSFMEQVKNPYCYKMGNVAVKADYTEDDTTFIELFGRMIARLIELETGLSTK